MPVSLRPSWFVNGLLGVALIGGGLWAYSSFDTAEANGASGTGTRTVPVSQGTVIATVTASGSVRSASTATAAFGTAGTVTAIKVKVGDTVKKGTVLAAVDDTGAKRQLAAAQGDLDAAQDALARANDADGDTSTAQTQVDQAELDVSEAQDGVDGTTLIAPMAGTVTAVNGTLGGSSGGTASTSGSGSGSGAAGSSSNAASGATSDSSSSGSGFVTIEDLTKLEVTASVAEADATRLKAGQVATVAWNALPDARADATLAAIDPNPTTANDVVTYGVTFGLASLPEGIRSGQTVEVSVVVGQVENALSVVSAAITSVGNRHTVTLDKNGQHVAQAVEIGLKGDQATEITSGLTVGEQVVVTISAGTGTQGGTGGLPGGGGFPGGGLTGAGGGPGGVRGGGPQGGGQ